MRRLRNGSRSSTTRVSGPLRSEHLASLATLAAGAAHELSTPLATIAVASRELERQAQRLSETLPLVEPLKEDARLIRTEVDRCQVILDAMSGRASEGVASAADPLPADAIANLVRSRLSDEHRSRLRVSIESGAPVPAAPGAAMVQAISSLLRNAFDASDPTSDVSLRFEQRGGMVRIEVRDRGAGMSPEVLRRAGEPFYTTKPAGHGMGLGLFLTRTFAERSGGALYFDTADGTTAVLEIPAVPGKEPLSHDHRQPHTADRRRRRPAPRAARARDARSRLRSALGPPTARRRSNWRARRARSWRSWICASPTTQASPSSAS